MAKEKAELQAEFKEKFDRPKLSDFNLTFDRADLVARIINKSEGREIIPPDEPLPPHDV